MFPVKRLKAMTANGQGFTTKQVIGSDNPYLKSLVDSGKFTQDEVDAAWAKAKRTATANAKANPNIVPSYAYTTAIFQSILGIKKRTEACVKVKVNAATRLVAAHADESQARKFLKSVSGVEVGKKEFSDPGVIRFQLDDLQAFKTAIDNLTKKYGKVDRSMTPATSSGGSWFLDDAKTKIIRLSDTKYGGGMNPNPFTISLVDKAHVESPMQLIKRISQSKSSPSRPISMR